MKGSNKFMLNLKKEADSLKVGDIQLGTCPVCSSYVSHIYFMQNSTDKKQSKWYSCACGVVWQVKYPDKVYDKKYYDEYAKYDSKLKDSFQYPVKIYAPIIEELVYGRKVLLIGRVNSHQEDAFKERGWVPYSIDKNEAQPKQDKLFVGNFETYNFSDNLKFNLIWIYHTLECFLDPVSALAKCKSLLTEDGILVICSPDTDFIHTRGSSCFIHWKPDMNYLMWNKRSISTHLEKLGFQIIIARQNYEHRFPFWDDYQLIAQKKFF